MLDRCKEHPLVSRCSGINLWSPLLNWNIFTPQFWVSFFLIISRFLGLLGAVVFLQTYLQFSLSILKKLLLFALNWQFCPDMQFSWHAMTYHRATPGKCKLPFFILGPIWQGSTVERSSIWLNGEMKVHSYSGKYFLMCLCIPLCTQLDMCGIYEVTTAWAQTIASSPSGFIIVAT